VFSTCKYFDFKFILSIEEILSTVFSLILINGLVNSATKYSARLDHSKIRINIAPIHERKFSLNDVRKYFACCLMK